MMGKSVYEVVELALDEGEGFEPGMRVDYAATGSAGSGPRLEKAVLGSYEVVRCDRADGDRRLTVTLRPSW